ncbi:GNAT family N-acetyltransferase [Nonomuraea sp. NPDC004297]
MTPSSTEAAGQARDVEVIGIELGVIWRLDERGRLPGPERMVIGAAADGMVAAVAHDVPGETAAQVLALVARSVPPPPGGPPAVLDDCRRLLGGPELRVTGGPSYQVIPPVRWGGAVQVLTSDAAEHVRLVRSLPRPAVWAAGEWAALLGGGAGAPWAMVAADGQVVSVCHTARLTPLGAEAGTWTSPAYRGRGLAAAATARWSALLPGIRLFYSTSADNHSSRRVARRLGLRTLGWIWHLTT